MEKITELLLLFIRRKSNGKKKKKKKGKKGKKKRQCPNQSKLKRLSYNKYYIIIYIVHNRMSRHLFIWGIIHHRIVQGAIKHVSANVNFLHYITPSPSMFFFLPQPSTSAFFFSFFIKIVTFPTY